MRYFTWKLDWSSGVGTDPTSTTNSSVTRFEPQFATGDIHNPETLIYSYLFGEDVMIPSLIQWQVTETTSEAMLAAALLVNPGATLVNGLIEFPEPNLPIPS
jgi:hypothetical protein